MNKILREFYLDYVNNYLTVEKIAEHNGIGTDHAIKLIEMGKEYHEEYCEVINGNNKSI